MNKYDVDFHAKATAVPAGFEETIRTEIEKLEADGLKNLAEICHEVVDLNSRVWVCVANDDGTIVYVVPSEDSSSGEHLGPLE